MIRRLAAASLLLSGLSITTARAETTVPKRSAYPQLQPSTIKPTMTAAEQEKIKKELNNAAARAKAKKP